MRHADFIDIGKAEGKTDIYFIRRLQHCVVFAADIACRFFYTHQNIVIQRQLPSPNVSLTMSITQVFHENSPLRFRYDTAILSFPVSLLFYL